MQPYDCPHVYYNHTLLWCVKVGLKLVVNKNIIVLQGLMNSQTSHGELWNAGRTLAWCWKQRIGGVLTHGNMENVCEVICCR